MAKAKGHPLESLTFNSSRLDEVSLPVVDTPAQTPVAGASTLPNNAKSADTPEEEKEETRSSNVTLPVRVWDWIDAKHLEARAKKGKRVRQAAIIRAVFDVVMAAEVDLSGIQSEKEISERIRYAIRQ